MKCEVPITITIETPNGEAAITAERLSFHSGRSFVAGAGVKKFTVYADCLPQLLELNDVFLVPDAKALYTRDGQIVLESCVRRGRTPNESILAGAERIVVPSAYNICETPIVYLSWLQNHWGHFLTEGISRLWAFTEHPELRRVPGIYCALNTPHPNILAFINALELRLHLAGRKCRTPTLLKKVFLPLPSFMNQNSCYAVHCQVPRLVTRALLGKVPVHTTDRPAVLSRSAFNGYRTIHRQEELDRCLQSSGCAIYYPENMTLEEQVLLFNSHRDIIGCWGSAFHCTILADNASELHVHMLCDGRPNVNYIMMDFITQVRSHYLDLLTPRNGCEQTWPHLQLTVEVEKVTEYLLESRGHCIPAHRDQRVQQ